MRMKFFERTYLLMLILFLIFLNGSIFALIAYTNNNSQRAAEQVCISEEYTIRTAFEHDQESKSSGNDYILQVTYATFYKDKDIFLRFERDGKLTYSSVPSELPSPKSGKIAWERLDGKRYILISNEVCDGAYTMTYVKDVSYLNDSFRSMAIVFVLTSLVGSTLLAIFLYLILRKLYSPLNKLRSVTERVSNGNFDARADEDGDDEFSSLAKDFNHMTDKINSQMNELRATANQKQRMLDDLAHEMRTPLTAIHGYAEYICNANISEAERIEATQFIMQESMRLKHISEILLDSAFIRENKIEKSPLSVKLLFSQAKQRFAPQASAKDIDIICSCTDETVLGDALLLELLLSNLIENAIKACSCSGRVEMGAAHVEEGIQIFVQDNGVGMSDAQLAHITEPFYRTDKSRSRKEGGTGLGLALCATIAKAHGTSLSFSSEVGKGTRASLILENFTAS